MRSSSKHGEPKPEPTAEPMIDCVPAPLTVALDLRLGLLAFSTFVSVALVAGITIVFHYGVQLGLYDGSTMSQKKRDDLLDTYNGYSGNIASALGRPLEFFIAIMAQVFVIRFFTASLLRPQPKWYLGVVAMTVSVVLGFFLNNGLNALNVQLRDHDIQAKINASDLAFQPNSSLVSEYLAKTSNITRTFSERQPRNPVTNTILRNVVLPRTPKSLPQCKVAYTGMRFPEDIIDYGFPQREWMQNLLPEALEAKTLRIVMNATDKNANKAVKSADLPMNASRAADLFLTALLTSSTYTPFGMQFNPSILRNVNWTEPSVRSTLRAGQNVAAAKTSGLLPPQQTASESDRREWLVDHIWTLFKTHGVVSDNVSLSNIGVEFAHVDLSPSLTLDAVTWEIDIDPKILTTRLARDNKTRNYNSKTECGPWPAICSFPRLENDDPVVVHAFAACVNPDGSETLMSLPGALNTTDYAVDCPQQSNTSMILLTASKRLVADSLSQNSSVDPTDAFESSTPYPVTTNLRKILSFTVSRLDWRPENLATKYHADCLSKECDGLDVALSDGQRMIVGTNALLTGLLSPINYHHDADLRPFPLVRLIEPPPTRQKAYSWSVIAGDLLLPHNVRNLTWDLTPHPLSASKSNECEVPREDRQQLVLNNHMYIEAPLQTTYMAALFFLFQNGVVRDEVAMNKYAKTLTFDGNVLNLSLWVSIPFRNAVLTCIGCFFLVIGCVSAIVWSSDGPSDESDTMHSIKTPHVIARVMMDDNSFPTSLVRRRVVADGMGHVGAKSSGVDRFYIESLVLESREKSHTNVNHV